MRTNFIDVDISREREKILRGFWQHDHGLKLRLTVAEDISKVRVHFAPVGYPISADVDCVQENTQWVCDVPAVALNKPTNMVAYVYTMSETAGWTTAVIRFGLTPRPNKEK